jgi:hypothetical protein
MVKDLVKRHFTLLSIAVFRNFCRVLHLVEGHNFRVDWHFKFGEEKHEKLAPRSASTVQEHRLAFKVDNYFLQNLLRKTP